MKTIKEDRIKQALDRLLDNVTGNCSGLFTETRLLQTGAVLNHVFSVIYRVNWREPLYCSASPTVNLTHTPS